MLRIFKLLGSVGVLLCLWVEPALAKERDLEAKVEVYDPFEEDVFEVSDPFEGVNRVIFAFNSGLNDFVLFPLTDVYTLFIPTVCRTGADNVFQNLFAPVKMLNYLFQGEGDRAGETLGRFLINTLLGLGGIFDVATDLGLPASDTTFGNTLETWGVGPGPYLVLPVLGPTSSRDALGMAVDYGMDPWNIWCLVRKKGNLLWGRSGLYTLQTIEKHKAQWWNLERTSMDFYAVVRSLYAQKRGYDAEWDEQNTDL